MINFLNIAQFIVQVRDCYNRRVDTPNYSG